MYTQDTIVAIATGTGNAGVGVVRVSGPLARKIGEKVGGIKLRDRSVDVVTFSGARGEGIDTGLIIYFEGPKSYTGEDVVELQGHGGIVVQSLLLDRCRELGARLAEGGEFTKRAFLNNKMDLIQAEAVLQLINAGTKRAALGAHRVLIGAESNRIKGLAGDLRKLLTEVEANIDFSEEEIGAISCSELLEKIGCLKKQGERILRSVRQGVLLSKGVKVAIVGEPNVGKSTLFNQLLGSSSAIVNSEPGTTRDVVRGFCEAGGLEVELVDTAGNRETDNLVEKEGIKKGKFEAQSAAVVIDVLDATTNRGRMKIDHRGYETRLIVKNKIDKLNQKAYREERDGIVRLGISAEREGDVDLVREALAEIIGAEQSDEPLIMGSARQAGAITDSIEHLGAAERVADSLDMAAEELRLAMQRLGKVTGEVTSDDILGDIFSSFCIGK